jgi:hypothetical protein
MLKIDFFSIARIWSGSSKAMKYPVNLIYWYSQGIRWQYEKSRGIALILF